MTDAADGRMTVVWITGLPSAGKTLLASRLARRLPHPVMLDSDEVRLALAMNDYGPEGRELFYRALAGLAGLLARQGHVVIVAATSPGRHQRRLARSLAPRFIEVYVDTPATECAERDAKGLYAASARGDVDALPGVGVPYEPPTVADVVAHGGKDDDALAAILHLVGP